MFPFYKQISHKILCVVSLGYAYTASVATLDSQVKKRQELNFLLISRYRAVMIDGDALIRVPSSAADSRVCRDKGEDARTCLTMRAMTLPAFCDNCFLCSSGRDDDARIRSDAGITCSDCTLFYCLSVNNASLVD